MKLILSIVFLLIHNISYAVPVTLYFSGVSGVGIVEGTFSYETDQNPTGFNVRGLSSNVTYAVSSWNIMATSNFDGLPSTLFNGRVGQSIEFCQGNCVFSSPFVSNLIFRDSGSNTLLQLTFSLVDQTPFTSPPDSLSEWGTFGNGQYRIAQSVPLALLTSGGLTSVPEPPSLALLLSTLGLGLLIHRLSKP